MTGYSLTWAGFGTSLISAVQLLRCHDELVDVTLSAGGRTFHAHKVVLCAASPLLLDLLKGTECKHPVVLLTGVQASDLEALLEFMYRGEVSIDQNQLPSLLQAAHSLNIQGLSPGPVDSHTLKDVAAKLPARHRKKHCISTDSGLGHQDGKVRKRKRIKSLSKSVQQETEAKWEKMYVQVEPENVIGCGETVQESLSQPWGQQIASSPSSVEGLPLQTSMLIQNIAGSINQTSSSILKNKGASDQPGVCPLCGSMLRQARNLRRHLLTSCKYRMVNALSNGGQQSSISPPVHLERNQESQLHQLQPLPMQQSLLQGNTDQQIDSKEGLSSVTMQSISAGHGGSLETVDSKDGLTPICCAELLNATSNIISDFSKEQ